MRPHDACDRQAIRCLLGAVQAYPWHNGNDLCGKSLCARDVRGIGTTSRNTYHRARITCVRGINQKSKLSGRAVNSIVDAVIGGHRTLKGRAA